MQINIDRLSREIDQLATFSEVPAPAVTRVLWTPTDVEARQYLLGLFAQAGLETRADALGNFFARWPGSAPDLPAVATGSHYDAIPYSGKYDGVLGVLGALEAVRALKSSGFAPRRGLEIIAFTSEEPTRFGMGCLGSRAMSGALSPAQLRALTDADGIGLDEARQTAGYDGELESVRLSEGVYSAFVELHIEQGPELERAHIPIGVVSAIAAPAAMRVELSGVGGHAGALLMDARRDALCAAAELSLAVERAARATGSRDTVATTGTFEVHPGAVNSVPSRVQLGIDARDIDGARRDEMVEQIRQSLDEICARRQVTGTLNIINADPPATCAPAIIAAAQGACDETDTQYQNMVSRAYHDSLFMARLAPMGMIFIPLQRRHQPPPRRVFVARRHQTRRRNFGAHLEQTQ